MGAVWLACKYAVSLQVYEHILAGGWADNTAPRMLLLFYCYAVQECGPAGGRLWSRRACARCRISQGEIQKSTVLYCAGIWNCGKQIVEQEGARSLWKGLTPFATHLTLKYALRMGTNAFYQSLLRDKVPPGPSLQWRGLLLCRALLALAGALSARPPLRMAKHIDGRLLTRFLAI